MNNQEIIQFYIKGASLAAISRKSNLSVYKIKQLLKKYNIKIRTKFEQTIYNNMERGKKINHNYFDILTEENVYYLGFLAAGGCVRPNRNEIKIGLSSIDREWLETFKSKLQSERDIKDYVTNKGFQVSELLFSSLKIKMELAKYSIVPNKTYKGVTMNNIPNSLKLAFIKGYFDGDGSFSINKNTKQCKISISSHTKEILEEINAYFNNVGYIYSYNNNYNLEFSTIPSLNIMKQFYELKTPYLKRKKEKYDKAILLRI